MHEWSQIPKTGAPRTALPSPRTATDAHFGPETLRWRLIGGNYTNVTSDIGACIAAGGTLHLVNQSRKRRNMEEERLMLARETHRLLHHVYGDGRCGPAAFRRGGPRPSSIAATSVPCTGNRRARTIHPSTPPEQRRIMDASAYLAEHLQEVPMLVAAILGIPYEQVMQVALIPVTHTISTEFKRGRGSPGDQRVHWDHW